MTPQIIYLFLFLVILLAAAHYHGKPKEGKYNFWTQLLTTVIQLLLLYYGGYFDKM